MNKFIPKTCKRFLALLLFAAMFIQMLPAAAFAAGTSQPTLAFSGASETAGDEVVIYLEIKDNPGLVALELALLYDRDRLTLVKVEDKGLITSYTQMENGRERRFYHLTHAGQGALREKENQWGIYTRAMARILGGVQE